MDYKAELERLKTYLQTEIDFISDDDALEDRYARQANKSTLEKVNQILKRGEAEPTDENSGLHLQRVTHSFITSIAEKYDIEPSKIVIGMQYDVLVVQKYDEGAADKWETLEMIDLNCG